MSVFIQIEQFLVPCWSIRDLFGVFFFCGCLGSIGLFLDTIGQFCCLDIFQLFWMVFGSFGPSSVALFGRLGLFWHLFVPVCHF